MSDLFYIINCIYTKQDSTWIDALDEYPSPVVLNKFLGMNDNISAYAKFLDRFVYWLDARHWIALAWSVVPKYSKAPFVKFIKKSDEVEMLEPLLAKVRNVLELGDSDYLCCKDLIVSEVLKDKKKWFSALGMGKEFVEKFGLNYSDLGGEIKTGKSGLELWDL